MSTIQDHLNHRLTTRSSYTLSPKDQRKIEQDIVGFILERITSGKFKKNKVEPETLINLTRKVKEAVESQKPLKFTFPFGGYKLFSMPSAPTVDYAEFFTMAYYADYVNQVAEHYRPGVEFYFVSDEVIINRMNNVPQSDIDAYTDSFKKLMELFNQNLPQNIRFKFQRVRDLYTSERELWDEVESFMPEVQNNWQEFTPEKKKSRKDMVLLNFKFDGEKDLTKLRNDDKKLEKLLEDNTTLHDAYMKLTKRRGFTRGEDKIVVFTKPINDSITLGTTKYSAVKFWTGLGALGETAGGGFADLVLSPQQLDRPFREEKIEQPLLPLKSFESIRVYSSSER